MSDVQAIEKLKRVCGDGKATRKVDGKTYRIRANAWGNWYGYEGTRKVQMFFGDYTEQAQDAIEWLESK